MTQRLRESRLESTEDIEWLRVMRFYDEGDVVRGAQAHGGEGEGREGVGLASWVIKWASDMLSRVNGGLG